MVLGAGLAGLAAAADLARAGFAVEVLEARGRVGGRVSTLRAPFGGRQYAEAGGEFIAPGHRALLDALDRFDLRTRPRPASRRLLHFAGREALGRSPAAIERRAGRALGRLGRATAGLAEAVPDPAAPWEAPLAAELDARSYADWLAERRLDPLAAAAQRVWTTVDYGVEPEQLSLLMVARDERLIALAPSGPSVGVVGGADQLPRALAAELGGRVRLGAVVEEVDQRSTAVRVRFREAGHRVTAEASFAICALPLAIVAGLRFRPAPAEARRRALAAVPTGQVLKVLLGFGRRFWREAGAAGGLLTDLPLQAGYDATLLQAGSQGILTVYTAGEVARELAALEPADRVARTLERLEGLFPNCRRDFLGGRSTDWQADPWSGGAYSHFRPGQVTACGHLLGQPDGRVHFAGEYTSEWQATMNGALESGLRAAREVAARLDRPEPLRPR